MQKRVMINNTVGNTENSIGLAIYMVSKMMPNETAKFNVTSRSRAIGGSVTNIKAIIITRAAARAISLERKIETKLEVMLRLAVVISHIIRWLVR